VAKLVENLQPIDLVGSFGQVTYSSSRNHLSWDNTDIRYTNNRLKLFRKGVSLPETLDNNPTVGLVEQHVRIALFMF